MKFAKGTYMYLLVIQEHVDWRTESVTNVCYSDLNLSNRDCFIGMTICELLISTTFLSALIMEFALIMIKCFGKVCIVQCINSGYTHGVYFRQAMLSMITCEVYWWKLSQKNV